MNKQEWKQVEVTTELIVPFQWRDLTPGGQNLGRAEFQVCLKFKRGRVSEFWVHPKQQRNAHTCWHYSNGDIYFHIASYEGLEDSKPWLVSWCKEHKTVRLNIYVPSEAKFLRIDFHGISFLRTEW